MKRIELVAIAMLSLALPSCIKEDRSTCPCYLHLDLSRLDRNYIHSLDLMFDQEHSGIWWKPVEQSYFGDTLILPVNKSEFDFCAWGNLAPEAVDNILRIISPFAPEDTLWSYSRRIETRCEDVYLSVLPQRQHIPVTIIVRGQTEGVRDIRPVLNNVSREFDFYGSAAGPLGQLIPDRVIAPSVPEGHYIFHTMLYTQQSATQAELELSFNRAGENMNARYPIGEMLQQIGEDISLCDQRPIIIELVLGNGSVFLTISIADWKRHSVIEITY